MSYAADVVVYNAAEAFGIHEVKFFPLTVAVVFAATLILSVVKRFVFDKYRAFYAKLSSPLVKVGCGSSHGRHNSCTVCLVEADGDKALYLAGKGRLHQFPKRVSRAFLRASLPTVRTPFMTKTVVSLWGFSTTKGSVLQRVQSSFSTTKCASCSSPPK